MTHLLVAATRGYVRVTRRSVSTYKGSLANAARVLLLIFGEHAAGSVWLDIPWPQDFCHQIIRLQLADWETDDGSYVWEVREWHPTR